MTSTMKLRSTDTSQNQEDENNDKNDPSERISILERTVGQMTNLLMSISLDLKELKFKPTSDVKAVITEQLKDIIDDNSSLVPTVINAIDPITYIKMYSHYCCKSPYLYHK